MLISRRCLGGNRGVGAVWGVGAAGVCVGLGVVTACPVEPVRGLYEGIRAGMLAVAGRGHPGRLCNTRDRWCVFLLHCRIVAVYEGVWRVSSGEDLPYKRK